MLFKKMLKRKRYNTWIGRDHNYVVYIFKMGNLYHFQIWYDCKCILISLNNQLCLGSLETVMGYINIWLIKNKGINI
jgi:hypothetical protein